MYVLPELVVVNPEEVRDVLRDVGTVEEGDVAAAAVPITRPFDLNSVIEAAAVQLLPE